ncbi:homoserine dehydrogenase, partial [bacterium]
NIVVELMGGEEPAKSYIMKAIENGKHIVTANKELIAKHGNEILDFAHKNNVLVYIEGSVAGGIPIIQTLKRDLIANKIETLMGIINGTTNYILTEMTQKKRDFADVLKEAQQLGYAESDPTSDIEGFDAAYKLSILSSLIFGHKVKVDEIYRQGISNVSVRDIEYADKLGYTIKLLAIAKQDKNGNFEARVHPTMLNSEHPLASVNGAFNAIWLNGDCVGDFMLYGRGAGQLPTASAVVADILNMALEMKLRSVLSWSYDKEYITISPIENISSKYYIRLHTQDKAGVIGIIGRDLGDSDVSINSLLQANTEGGNAEIVLITHPVKEENMQAGTQEMHKAAYSLVIEALSKTIQKYPRNELLSLCMAKVYFVELQDSFKALDLVNKMQDKNTSFTGRVSLQTISKELNRFNQSLGQTDSKEKKRNSHLSYFAYRSKAQILKKRIKIEIDDHLKLWKSFCHNELDVLKVVSQASKISPHTRHTMDYWNKNFEGFEVLNVNASLMYGLYLEIVQAIPYGSHTFFKKAYNSINNKWHIHREILDVVTGSCAIIVASVEPDKIGKIIDHSSSVKSLFKTSEHELIGSNIAVVLPNIV